MIEKLNYATDRPLFNVLEPYRNLEASVLRETLEPRRSHLVNICMNHTKDFNKSSVLRASNAFLARATVLVGRRSFDRRGTTGLHLLENVYHGDTLGEVTQVLREEGYTILGVHNSLAAESIFQVELPLKTAFVFGEEQRPLTPEELKLCDTLVTIPQRGVVRSLNTGQNGALFMGEYRRRLENLS